MREVQVEAGADSNVCLMHEGEAGAVRETESAGRGLSEERERIAAYCWVNSEYGDAACVEGVQKLESKPVVLERAVQIRNSFVEDKSGGDKLVLVLQGAP
jgi:hypothetical protein